MSRKQDENINTKSIASIFFLLCGTVKSSHLKSTKRVLYPCLYVVKREFFSVVHLQGPGEERSHTEERCHGTKDFDSATACFKI